MIASISLFLPGIIGIYLFSSVKCLLVSMTRIYKSHHLRVFVEDLVLSRKLKGILYHRNTHILALASFVISTFKF